MALPSYLPTGAGTSFGGGSAGPAAPRPYLPMKPKKLSVSEMLAQRYRGGPNMSIGTDPTTGQRLTNDEFAARGPLSHAGWNTSGVGPGTRGYRGSWAHGGYNYGEGTRRPSARNSAEYYSQRDESMNGGLGGGAMGYLELGNRANREAFMEQRQQTSGSVWDQSKSSSMGGQGLEGFGEGQSQTKAPQIGVIDTIIQQGASGGIPKSSADALVNEVKSGAMTVEQARAMASQLWNNAQSSAKVQEQALIEDARKSEIQQRRDDAIKRANAMGGSAGVEFTSPGQPRPQSMIGGVPSSVAFQAMANNQGIPNKYASPLPAGPLGPTDEYAKYAMSGQLNQFRPPQFGVSYASPLNVPQKFGISQPPAPQIPLPSPASQLPQPIPRLTPGTVIGGGKPSAIPSYVSIFKPPTPEEIAQSVGSQRYGTDKFGAVLSPEYLKETRRLLETGPQRSRAERLADFLRERNDRLNAEQSKRPNLIDWLFKP